MNLPDVLGVDSKSIIFNRCSFQKPIAAFCEVLMVSWKKDPWKECGSVPENADFDLAMGQHPNRTPSEHPEPTTKIDGRMCGALAPK